MKAKFEGKCRDCGGLIYAGDEIRWSRAEGARHGDTNVCDSYHELRAEQEAEMRMEAWAEARLSGTTSSFWENYG
jgi:hypothetical protein